MNAPYFYPTSTQSGWSCSSAVLPAKRRINIFLDSATLEYFKAKACGRGYQTSINETLKQAMQAENLEAVMRKAA